MGQPNFGLNPIYLPMEERAEKMRLTEKRFFENSSPNPPILSFKSTDTTRKRIELNITNAP